MFEPIVLGYDPENKFLKLIFVRLHIIIDICMKNKKIFLPLKITTLKSYNYILKIEKPNHCFT